MTTNPAGFKVPGWLAVLKKELRDIFRDRRTTLNVIFSPLVITPMIFALIGNMTSKRSKEMESERVSIAIVNSAKAPRLMEAIKGADNIDFTPTDRQTAEDGIRKRRFKAAAVVPDDAQQAMGEDRTVKITLLVDEGNDTSVGAGRRLEGLFEERGKRVVAQRLMEQGLSSELATPFQTVRKGIEGGGSVAILMLSTILPYMLALYAITGGVSAANDLVAGEKERGTLETLLVSPASRRDLVVGKFLCVVSVSLLSSVLSVVGMLWPFYTPFKVFHWLAEGGLTLTPLSILMILLVQIPLAVLGAGVLLVISTFSRNQREAQTYLGPVLIVASTLAIMSMILKADAGIVYAFAPILNAALVLRQSLDGTPNAMFVGIASVTSFIYAVVALVLAVILFEREDVLMKA